MSNLGLKHFPFTLQNWPMYSVFHLIDLHSLPLSESLFRGTAGRHVVMTTVPRWEEGFFQMASDRF